MNKEMMRVLGFGEEIDMINEGLCPICGERVDESEFTDTLSSKNFKISGICQTCQDSVFNCSDDEDNNALCFCDNCKSCWDYRGERDTICPQCGEIVAP